MGDAEHLPATADQQMLSELPSMFSVRGISHRISSTARTSVEATSMAMNPELWIGSKASVVARLASRRESDRKPPLPRYQAFATSGVAGTSAVRVTFQGQP